MKNIRKTGVIPAKYTLIPDCGAVFKEVLNGMEKGDIFMRLFDMVGAPETKGVFKIRYDNMVFVIEFTDSGVDYKGYMSPNTTLMAKRRMVKTINVIARELNEGDIPFMADSDCLYYAVKVKNDRLVKATKNAEEVFRKAVKEKEKWLEFGIWYCIEAETAIREICNVIKEKI